MSPPSVAKRKHFNARRNHRNPTRNFIFAGRSGGSALARNGRGIKRVAQYSRLLALHYGLNENKANLIKMASPLHDVGKIGISDNILNKPGKLSDDERAHYENSRSYWGGNPKNRSAAF